MPIARRWKLIAGSVSAAIAVSAAAAGARPGSDDQIQVQDPVPITEVVDIPVDGLASDSDPETAVDDSYASPFDSTDTDDDGLTDVAEDELGTDPADADTDDDGLETTVTRSRSSAPIRSPQTAMATGSTTVKRFEPVRIPSMRRAFPTATMSRRQTLRTVATAPTLRTPVTPPIPRTAATAPIPPTPSTPPTTSSRPRTS